MLITLLPKYTYQSGRSKAHGGHWAQRQRKGEITMTDKKKPRQSCMPSKGHNAVMWTMIRGTNKETEILGARTRGDVQRSAPLRACRSLLPKTPKPSQSGSRFHSLEFEVYPRKAPLCYCLNHPRRHHERTFQPDLNQSVVLTQKRITRFRRQKTAMMIKTKTR